MQRRGLQPVEWRRRGWHILPGFLPMILWFIPHRDPLSPLLWTVLLLITAGLALSAFLRYRVIARPAEADRVQSVAGYAGSILVTLLIFPGDAEIGLTVLAILAFGDGPATLAGLLVDGPRLPWNREKTWAGFLAFVAVGTPMASLIHWGETEFNPESVPEQFPFSDSLLCCGAAVALAAIAESVPSRINDNIRVGLTAAAAVSLLHGLLIGWH